MLLQQRRDGRSLIPVLRAPRFLYPGCRRRLTGCLLFLIREGEDAVIRFALPSIALVAVAG